MDFYSESLIKIAIQTKFQEFKSPLFVENQKIPSL